MQSSNKHRPLRGHPLMSRKHRRSWRDHKQMRAYRAGYLARLKRAQCRSPIPRLCSKRQLLETSLMMLIWKSTAKAWSAYLMFSKHTELQPGHLSLFLTPTYSPSSKNRSQPLDLVQRCTWTAIGLGPTAASFLIQMWRHKKKNTVLWNIRTYITITTTSSCKHYPKNQTLDDHSGADSTEGEERTGSDVWVRGKKKLQHSET